MRESRKARTESSSSHGATLGMRGTDSKSSHQDRRGKALRIVAICALVIFVLGMGVVAYLTLVPHGETDSPSTNDTANVSDARGNGTLDRNTEIDGTHSTSETTTNLNGATNDGNGSHADNASNQATAGSDQGNESTADSQPFDVTSKIPTFARETFDSIDQDAMKQRASDFVTSLMTFDSGSLSDGSWRSSVAQYVDTDLVDKDGNPSKNFLIPRCTDDRWATNCSTYSDFFSKVEDISNVTIYASAADKGYDFVPIKVLLTAREYRCAGDIPANDNNWQSTMRYDTRYEVSMTSSGQIYRVVRTGKTIVESDINGWGKTHDYGGKAPYADNIGDPGDDSIPD